MKGSLIIVGMGMTFESHLTLEAISCLQTAERVFFLANDQLVSKRFQAQFPESFDLSQFYLQDIDRTFTYDLMTEIILYSLRQGNRVCVAFYGHPGVLVSPSREAVVRARLEGYEVALLPGISAEACLFADLNIDPGEAGCQTYEATDFLIRPRRFDTSAGLLLWQVGFIGNLKPPDAETSEGFSLLIDKLINFYGSDHNIFLYIASTNLQQGSEVYYLPLEDVEGIIITSATTMYVPPKSEPQIDEEMMMKLGLS